MIQVCPNCGRPVARRWLLLGGMSDAYQCPQCKLRLTWTWRRYLVSFLAGLIGALPIPLAFKVEHMPWWILIVIYLMILSLDVLFILKVPGQFKVEKILTTKN